VYMSGFIWLTERTTLRNQICPMSQSIKIVPASSVIWTLPFVKAADQEVHLPVLFEGGYITSVQLTEIGKGTLFPCIYGRVKYWDSFEREHETRILLYLPH